MYPYAIEQTDVTDEEIQAYVQQVMDKNEWEMLVSIERIEETSRVVMKAPDEIVVCPCGKSFPLSKSHGHWFGDNYCSAKCWDNHPPEPECTNLRG